MSEILASVNNSKISDIYKLVVSMKYIYILTSTPKDFYYEQCLMSVFSLKAHNPNAQVQVLVDNKTAESFTAENKRDGLKNSVLKLFLLNLTNP